MVPSELNKPASLSSGELEMVLCFSAVASNMISSILIITADRNGRAAVSLTALPEAAQNKTKVNISGRTVTGMGRCDG